MIDKLQSKEVEDYDFEAPSTSGSGRLNFKTHTPIQIGTEFLFDTELLGELKFKVAQVNEHRPSVLSTYGFGPPVTSFSVRAIQQKGVK